MMIEKVLCNLTSFKVFLKETFKTKTLKEFLETKTKILKETRNV